MPTPTTINGSDVGCLQECCQYGRGTNRFGYYAAPNATHDGERGCYLCDVSSNWHWTSLTVVG